MKVEVPKMTVVNGSEVARVMGRLQKYFSEEGVTPTMGASACLMMFAAMLKASGHAESVGHDSLDRMFRILDTEKAS